MKFYKWLIALALVCSTQLAYADADTDCGSCDTECEEKGCLANCDFSIYGDFLWWKVCRTELDFDEGGTVYYVTPTYDPGYRLGAKINCCCTDFGIRYTSYDTDQTKKNPADTEEDHYVRYYFDYDVVDLEIGFNFNVDCACGKIRPFAGVKFADIHEKLNKTDIGGDVFKFDFSGTGLYLGAEGNFNVYTWLSCDGCWYVPFNLVARASAGVLDGRFNHSSTDANKRRDECLYVPVNEFMVAAEIGLNGCNPCFHPKFFIGYEVQTLGPWKDWDSETDVGSLGLGGMVLGLDIDF